MILHTEAWLILAHREITPTVRVIVDGWRRVYTYECNADGVRINFPTEALAKSAWRAVEGAWSLDKGPSEDDEESNATSHQAGASPALVQALDGPALGAK
jgi:hypothetical protein